MKNNWNITLKNNSYYLVAYKMYIYLRVFYGNAGIILILICIEIGKSDRRVPPMSLIKDNFQKLNLCN
jgi:hypothetical protein